MPDSPKLILSNNQAASTIHDIGAQAADTSHLIMQAVDVLKLEAAELLSIAERLKLSDSFAKAITLLLGATGKIVVTGMGKSGHIGSKIAATLASTGSPAFFVHPAELRHGDFGMLESRDIVIALSGSGETQEITLVLEPIKRAGLAIIALTGNTESTLARFSDVVLDVAVSREACPFNLAPTSSTTAALVMGDAIAMVLMSCKQFKIDDYARSHPGGNLGRQLVTVRDVMRSGIDIPKVEQNSTYQTVLNEIDGKRLGFTCVVNDAGQLKGIITDGDIRRSIVRLGAQAFDLKAEALMSKDPKTIKEASLAVEALKLMDKHSISDLVILNDYKEPRGVIHLKDLISAGVV